MFSEASSDKMRGDCSFVDIGGIDDHRDKLYIDNKY